ncbi:MAG: GNAT family N-acetyltransferase [Bacteroidales bacterium]|nr:GNAT family N-acetyltransferase [Bacteroidales bacterium]
MELRISEVKTKNDLKTFVNFPFSLYKNNKYWVPYLKSEEIKTLQAKYNPAFEHCKAKFWLAYYNNEVVGRIGAIINYEYNKKVNKNIGRFSRFECINDKNVANELLKTVENWLKSERMEYVYGPLGFNNLDTQGLLVEGFEYLPSVASVYHHQYYKELIESCGYKKEIDWIEFRLTIKEVPEKAKKFSELVKKRYNLKVLQFKSTKELLNYSDQIFNLFNIAFSPLFSVNQLNEKMKEYYKKKYLKLLNPEFIKLIEDENKNIIAFIIGMPSLSEAMQKAKGRLFPFGIYYIYKALKKPEVVDLLLTAIHPNYQSKGVSAILINELQKTMLEKGVKYAETTGIFETNHDAINHWKNYEHIQHKRKRCYMKELK